jgi:hypothetical protein
MEENPKAWGSQPRRRGRDSATFLAIAVGEAVNVNGIDRDAARVTFEEGDREGTTGRVLFYKLRPRTE